MDRRLALVTLWLAFAAAAVGVGFAAAGLVGDPFTDGVPQAASEPLPTGASPSTATSVQGRSGSPSATPSPTDPPSSGTDTSTTGPASTRSTRTGSANTGTASTGSTRTDTATHRVTESTAPAVTRALSTRAGLVSATCRGEQVRLAASPAVGWEIADLDPVSRSSARVRFERVGDDDGRVEVRVECEAGRPRFDLDDNG
jgi:hypothetical protein